VYSLVCRGCRIGFGTAAVALYRAAAPGRTRTSPTSPQVSSSRSSRGPINQQNVLPNSLLGERAASFRRPSRRGKMGPRDKPEDDIEGGFRGGAIRLLTHPCQITLPPPVMAAPKRSAGRAQRAGGHPPQISACVMMPVEQDCCHIPFQRYHRAK